MKAIYTILAIVVFASVTFAADIARPNLDLKSADIAKNQIRQVVTTNNIMISVPLSSKASPDFSAFVRTYTEHLTAVSVSLDGVKVADFVTMARRVKGDEDTGVCLLFFGKHRSDAAKVMRILKR